MSALHDMEIREALASGEEWREAGKNSDGKADTGKPQMNLLFEQFAEELHDVAKILTFGAEKYPMHDGKSWQYVPNAEKRYIDAMYRHLTAIHQGEVNDPESGLSHWAHVMCNMLFLFKGTRPLPGYEELFGPLNLFELRQHETEHDSTSK